jgi:hypothetical protein
MAGDSSASQHLLLKWKGVHETGSTPTGSFCAYLRDALDAFAPYGKDALEIVKAVKGIEAFAQTLTGVFVRAKEHPDALNEARNRRRVGARSIEAIVKIAAKSQSVVELRHWTADGEIMDLKVTPIEAVQIREDARVHHASIPSSKTLTRAELTGNKAPPISLQTTPTLFQPSDYADSLARVYGRLDAKGGSVVDAEVRTAVAAVTNSLTSARLGSLISGIASNLEVRGRYNLAQMLRVEMQAQNRDQLPR